MLEYRISQNFGEFGITKKFEKFGILHSIEIVLELEGKSMVNFCFVVQNFISVVKQNLCKN